ncbi:MAG: D-sedoheptulose 7-phosphate isomerase [Candidatus Goldbacteria bacterium]|nr:D-sedoheptulose 7-phosphate isomerase [Candidatus Goldiibacteriota bacterium]HPD18586.1 D-sedoheptulose 7-phosphate isomerase [Candidatus Goldiibacteriota bacterium]
MNKNFNRYVNDTCKVIQKSYKVNETVLQKTVFMLSEALLNGKKILIYGNGGSAADAQHMAAELLVRLNLNRKAYPAIALTTDTSVITSCANDFSFADVFSRQIEALGNNGDAAVAISTSGNSENVIKGIKAARKKGLYVIGLTGEDGGKMKNLCDILINVKSKNTMLIQQVHVVFIHMICDELEKKLTRIENA